MAVKGGSVADGTKRVDAEMVRFAGAVISLGSDYRGDGYREEFAWCWDAEQGRAVRVFIGWSDWDQSGSFGSAVVDATPEVVEAFIATLVEERLAVLRREAECRATEVVRDREVRVVSGRKVPIGTEGRVFWTGTSTYGYNRKEERIGLVTAAGEKFFTAATNCKVLDPKVPAEAALRAQASREVEARPFTQSLRLPRKAS